MGLKKSFGATGFAHGGAKTRAQQHLAIASRAVHVRGLEDPYSRKHQASATRLRFAKVAAKREAMTPHHVNPHNGHKVTMH